ncbi:hypothetical protein BSKO_13656 [Bryopsis sp. KO-2023]|nr:hypothetical protein BSKO_13656 [Bryopsis sp. KO-2023]
MKKDISTTYLGSGHQYLFSHTSEENANAAKFSPTVPNQINLYLPELSAPAHGLVRALVMDSNDGNRTLDDGFPFLDSDGSFENNKLRNVTDHVELEDGQWHMVTLTTKPRGATGIKLYIDGELAGETPDVPGVGGGDPMAIDGKIFLCGRVDGNPERHFDGSLAKLSLYDDMLTPLEVKALYSLVFESTETEEVLGKAKDDDDEEDAIEVEDDEKVFKDSLRVEEDVKSGLRFVRMQEHDMALHRVVSLGAEVDVLEKITVAGLVNDTTLCTTNPEATGIDEDELKEQCETGEVCAPIHQKLLALLYKNSELPDDDKLFLNGACNAPPKGGISGTQADDELPIPVSYFPLTGGSVESWPVANAQGVSVNVELIKDKAFGSVFRCSQDEGSFIVLDNVPYGEKGSFAINMWFRPTNLTGNAFQYIFSHSGVVPTLDAWQSNQVQIYLAENNHSAGGVVRTIVFDSDDGGRGPQTQVYLDSDGDVSVTVKNEDAIPVVDISDKSWHMVTVSTRPDLKNGYSLYMDGELAGEMEEGEIYPGDDDVPREASAGGPLRPGGKIYLCGRHDGHATRHFEGDVAQLGLYDRALSTEEVATLYDSAVAKEPILKSKIPPKPLKKKPTKPTKPGTTTLKLGSPAASTPAATEDPAATEEPAAPATPNVSDLDKKKRRLAQNFQGQPLPAGLDASGASALEPTEAPVGAPPDLPKDSYIGVLSGEDGELFGGCTGNGPDQDVSCDKGLACMPVLTPAEEPNPEKRLERVGMCAIIPPHGAYSFDSEYDIEPPIAYFPLTGDNVDSWPFPTFKGLPSGKVEFVDDDVFGSVLSCSQDNQDQLVLDPVDYAATGGFTISLWLRRRPHHVTEGEGYQFVFSHNDAGGYSGIKGRSQVQIYFPEETHQLFGLVRAVVRDSNDLDDGTDASVSFLDSDGTFASNTAREFPPKMANFSDDQWHMLTITSHEENEPGYSIFVDGVLAADVKEGPSVTGGDPINLDGPIYLCGRSDEKPDRHFDGTLAHLTLWNSVLTKQEVFVLYERFILASKGMQVPHPNRQGVNGEGCFFPGILRGKLVQDCSELDGVLKCPNKEGHWIECAPFDDEPVPVAVDIEPAERFTINGEKCELPDTYNGKQIFDCIPINGKEPRCQVVGKPGSWEICAPKDDPEESVPEGFETERPPPVATVAAGRIVSRVTVDGKTCVFPFWHKGKSVADCVDIGGSNQCQVASGELSKCADIVYTKTGTPCAFPFTDENDPSKPVTSCVKKDGNDMCKNAEGFWEECGGKPAVTDSFPLLLPGRITADKEQCAFPFWYKGKLVSSCVDISGEAGSTGSGFRCRAENGQFAECAPARTTITGNQCSLPFTYNDEKAIDCIDVDGKEQCMVADGSFEECSPASKSFFGTKEEPDVTEPAIRFTLAGEQCVLPFMYNGKVQNNCVDIDGIESCKGPSEEWDECAPEDKIQVVKRTTIDGDDCTMPFVLDGRLNTDCVENTEGTEICRVGDDLAECAPLESNPETVEKTVELPMRRITINGDHCRFPFTYNGDLWVDCTELDGVETCKDSDGEWQECEPRTKTEATETPLKVEPSTRQTVSGDECVFPLSYNGKSVNDCVEIDGVESCKDSDGEWQECEPQAKTPLKVESSTRQTVSGDECVFPLSYNGKSVDDCVEIDGVESCKDSDGEWQECEPETKTPLKVDESSTRQTVSGEECVFPLSYNGKSVDDCVEIDGVESCKDSDGEWQECEPQAKTEATKTPLKMDEPSTRQTVSGDDCVFPLSYNGKSVNDCVEVDGVESCKNTDDEWEECEAVSGAALEMVAGSERVTVNGNLCAFPFDYQGDEVTTCITVDSVESCKNSDGEWEECVIPRVTVAGELCDFPFDYNGDKMAECVEIEGVESCKVSSGEWAECAKDRSTVTGIQCRFPFPFEGQIMTQCVEVDGVEKCQSVNGTWEACVPHEEEKKPVQERLSVSGKLCQFPFTHKGKMRYSCVKHKHTHVCDVGDGVLEECAKRGKESNAVRLQSEEEEAATGHEEKKRHRRHRKKNKGGMNAASVGIIVAAVICGVGLILIIAAVILFRRRKGGKFNEESSKGFEKFDDAAEEGQNIAMAAMGSSGPRGGKKGKKKTMDMFQGENGTEGDDATL